MCALNGGMARRQAGIRVSCEGPPDETDACLNLCVNIVHVFAGVGGPTYTPKSMAGLPAVGVWSGVVKARASCERFPVSRLRRAGFGGPVVAVKEVERGNFGFFGLLHLLFHSAATLYSCRPCEPRRAMQWDAL